MEVVPKGMARTKSNAGTIRVLPCWSQIPNRSVRLADSHYQIPTDRMVIIHETGLADTFRLEVSRIEDDRGFFGRLWCSKELAEHRLNPSIAQINVGFSPKIGTLRGMHYQLAPFEEVKIVRCTRGAVYDVVVDLRKSSSTYLKWTGAELTEDNLQMMYVPEGCAHGYLTLSSNAEIYYLTSEVYSRESSQGLRYDDPAIGIKWPAGANVISGSDLNWPAYYP